jgi:predicted glycogen debranching enzyme
LYDYINGDHRDTAVRPNQIFAVGLLFPLLTGVKARQVLKIVEEKLYTPVVRSLWRDDPNYHPLYGGYPFSRDNAYHQGTVWSWLLGPFVAAVISVEGARRKKKAVTN